MVESISADTAGKKGGDAALRARLIVVRRVGGARARQMDAFHKNNMMRAEHRSSGPEMARFRPDGRRRIRPTALTARSERLCSAKPDLTHRPSGAGLAGPPPFALAVGKTPGSFPRPARPRTPPSSGAACTRRTRAAGSGCRGPRPQRQRAAGVVAEADDQAEPRWRRAVAALVGVRPEDRLPVDAVRGRRLAVRRDAALEPRERAQLPRRRESATARASSESEHPGGAGRMGARARLWKSAFAAGSRSGGICPS